MSKSTKSKFIKAAEKYFVGFPTALGLYSYIFDAPDVVYDSCSNYYDNNPNSGPGSIEQVALFILLVGEAENEQVH